MQIILIFVALVLLGVVGFYIRQVKRYQQLLLAEQAALRLVLSNVDVSLKLREICRLIEAQIPGAMCSVMLADQDKQTLSPFVSIGLPQDFLAHLHGFPIADKNGACGDAAFHKQPVFVPDLRQDARFQSYLGLADQYGLVACWSQPCMDLQGDILGTFALYFKRVSKPRSDHLRLLEQARELTVLILTREREQTELSTLKRGVEASVNGVVIADAKRPGWPLVYVNPAFEKMTGYAKDEMLGRNCSMLQGADTDPRAIEQIRNRLIKQKDVQTTLKNYRKDGTLFWNDLYIAPVRDSAGELTHFVGIQNDVTERKQQEDELAWHATHDVLTRLPNRMLLEDRLAQAWRSAQRHNESLAVMFLDLDGFKPINDSLGHDVGDSLLQQVAVRLVRLIRDGDTLARFGGDEFVVVLASPVNEADANRIAERLLVAVSEPFTVGERRLTLTASIGLSLSQPDTENPSVLIQQADMAMYKAKRRGNNNYEWFSDAINEKLEHHVMMRHELHTAVTNDEFFLEYQPIYRTNGQVVGAEVLIRWRHPTRGIIPPGEFITLAETTGQIIAVGRWVLEQVCRDIPRLKALGMERVGLNLSPIQLNRQGFFEELLEMTRQYKVLPECIVIELTENVLVSELSNAVQTLEELHDAGFKIALDDFGTGYSSLRYLQTLPIDIIKIDRTFVHASGPSHPYEPIARAMLALAHELGVDAVGEGVETQEHLTFLREHRCGFAQGFYLCRPKLLSVLEQEFSSIA
ncbi:putative bifunctional diguanylate cyclase/phosphodiesterase [Aliidiomarina sanyensis]|uniref:GGDEF domain-containing protein n=1 Tax=Aliidiomarina sanyensis TaxID=1249555 RepID=A0A432WN07_9GAMM|nr:EAL domain-containing protein [Aliidiomarina sanyensis]RUO35173.1 GGDEF domain-containing protein [Aliidiomarina sanyensis]